MSSGNYIVDNHDQAEYKPHEPDCRCDMCNLNYGHIICGYCLEVKEDRRKPSCDNCEHGEFIRNHLKGK